MNYYLSWPRRAGKTYLRKRLVHIDRIETAIETLRSLQDDFEQAASLANLWAHFHDRERANLHTITAQWIKEHQ